MEKTSKQKKHFYMGQMDAAFLVIVLILVSLGLIMVFSASYPNAYYLKGNSLHFISRQLAYAVVGICAMLFVSKIDYRILMPLAFPAYAVSILLLIVVLFMRPLNNARRWIIIGSFTFQPSEIAKFSVVILFSFLICRFGDKMKTFKYGFMPFVALLIPIAALMLLEPHISGTMLILLLGAVMMFIGGTNQKLFIAAAAIGALCIFAVIAKPDLLSLIAHYAGERIEVWLDPFSDPLDGGFQTLQSLYAIGSGGLMGLGISGSRQKYLFLPEPHNDFIFAIICEELGFLGAVFIICLFVLLLWRGFVIAVRCPNKFGSLVAAGLVSQVGIQTILNIAVVTNTLPNTGISLPFFSYGGTSLLMLLCQMGVILSISRTVPIEKE